MITLRYGGWEVTRSKGAAPPTQRRFCRRKISRYSATAVEDAERRVTVEEPLKQVHG
jgi:hypothetical protein